MWSEYFEGISDPRQAGKVKHKLIEIIILVIAAVTAECEYWYQISHWCGVKAELLKEKLGLELANGVPSHDTMERVFQMMNPTELENRFMLWTTAVSKVLRGDSINIDGKVLCGSVDNETEALKMVSAWANREKLVLGQLRVPEGSNEITAVPVLLDMLDIEDCVITSDSLNCQKEITGKIVENGADYVLGLKGNHEKLHTAVEEHFLYNPLSANSAIKNVCEAGHGRVEQREYWLETELNFLKDVPEIDLWSKLNAVGMVKSVITRGEKTSFEIRYFLTSLTDVEHFAKSVREHWGIENSLHWCLDVGFNEDKARTRKDNSAENFAVIRHIVTNLLKRHPDKMSVRGKRHRCAYDDDFLLQILFAIE